MADGEPASAGRKAGRSRKSTLRCPVCKAPAVEAFRPFCSKRCADVDLNRWLGGHYAIPVETDADEDGDKPRPPESPPTEH